MARKLTRALAAALVCLSMIAPVVTAAPQVDLHWAQRHLDEGHWESAEAIARTAIEQARTENDDRAEVRARQVLMECLRELGRFDEAQVQLGQTSQLLRESAAPDSTEAAELPYHEGLIALARGGALESLAPLARAVAAAQDLALPGLEFRSRLARCDALFLLRHEDAATEELKLTEALAIDPRQRADVLRMRAIARRRQGQSALARHHVDAMLGEASRWIDNASSAGERRHRGRISRRYFETAIHEVWPTPTDGTERSGEAWPAADEWLRRLQGLRRGSTNGPGANEPRILWFWGSRDVLSWTRVAGQRPVIRRCGDPRQIREWILLFRSLLADPARSEERDQVGGWLVRALLGSEPAAGSTLRLQADGPIHALPFAILPTASGPLGTVCPLVHGAPDTGTSAAPYATSGELLVIAAPGPIPIDAVVREAETVASRVSGARIVTGPAAMEARIMGATSPTILHVIAPASPNPEDAALLLAPGDGQDGRLTDEEIRRLPHAPQVVILSSCESALSDASGHTSTDGLGAAFLEAGSATVVQALWKMGDRTPAPLMASFHSHLQRGARPSEAMRRARAEASDPRVWAAFIVRGRDVPVLLPEPPPKKNRGPEAAVGFASALAFAALLGWPRRRSG